MAEDGGESMTTPRHASDLRQQLRDLGLADSAITAVWPTWWSEDADISSSARADLAFTVARGLGIDPASLMGNEVPRFLWRAEARFMREVVDERQAVDTVERDRETEEMRQVLGSVALSSVLATGLGYRGFFTSSHQLRDLEPR